MRSRWRSGLAALAGVVAAHAPLAAQSDDARLVAQCQSSMSCLIEAQAAVLLAPALGIAFTGGNPAVGSTSTLGMRLGSLPRFAVGVRTGVVSTEVPEVAAIGVYEGARRSFGSFGGELAVGLLAGISPAPTVGGVASLDLLAAAGVGPFGGDVEGSAFAWGAGLRLGLLRESLTLPGLSVTVMYHALGDVDYRLGAARAGADVSAWSARATAGKQFFSFGLLAGVGYDRYTSDLRFFDTGVSDYTRGLVSAFANASMTLLVLTAAVEAGWQQGPGLLPGVTEQDADVSAERGTLFGSIALRLSI